MRYPDGAPHCPFERLDCTDQAHHPVPQRKTADSPLADTQGGAVGHDGRPNMQGSHPDPHFHRTSIPFNYRLETAVINCYRQTHLCLCDLPQSGRERCEERSGTFPYHQPGIASYRKR